MVSRAGAALMVAGITLISILETHPLAIRRGPAF
jgi:hypothetical protein